MVRNYKKKTDLKPHSPRKLKKAIELVKRGYSIRVAAKESHVNRSALWRVLKKTRNVPEGDPIPSESLNLSHQSRLIFPGKLEDSIASYCIDMARMGFGLTVDKVRELAYETAEKNHLKLPPGWHRDKLAGIEWFYGFKARHPNLSIRMPEGCSLARAAAFNPTNVKVFFDKLEEVLRRDLSFRDGSRVYNLDETCTSTVQNTRKIVSPKGVKQVHQVKSAEQGVSVTTCCIVGARGIVVPPVMIFPRKKFLNCMLANCFPDTLGLANRNGYMTKELFVPVIRHFIKNTNSSKENPTLLMVDNCEAHLSGEVIELCREYGVTLFTFPPHCTHKLQPLDLSVFGPFSAYYASAVNSWMLNHPGQPVSIYEIAQFVRDALSKAATPGNILAGFRQAGIFPFNRDVFQESDFIMFEVTKQPNPNDFSGSSSTVNVNSFPPHAPSAVVDNDIISDSENSLQGNVPVPLFVSPQDIRGYPKAKPKDPLRNPRKKGKCRIATDTPEKEEIQEREKEKGQKGEGQKMKRKTEQVTDKGAKKAKNNAPKSAKKKLNFQTEKNENDDCNSDSDTEKALEAKVSAASRIKNQSLPRTPEEEDYVLVMFTGQGIKYYVGKIIKNVDDDGDLEISYLRKSDKSKEKDRVNFYLPPVPDLYCVNMNDIKIILPKPSYCEGSTKRQQSYISFDFDFSGFNLG